MPVKRYNSRGNSPQIEADRALQNTFIHLNREQVEHFTQGDGLFLKDDVGNNIGFIHEYCLAEPNTNADLQGKIMNANAVLEFLGLTICQGKEPLELNITAQIGLQLVLEDIQGKLDVSS